MATTQNVANEYQTALWNKWGRIIINDQLLNYRGIWDFGIRDAQYDSEGIELTNLDIVIPEDYSLTDTDEFQEGAPSGSTTEAFVNYKKKFKTTVSTANLRSAIVRGELPQYVALISKRLTDSLIVDREKAMDSELDTFFVNNPSFKKTITNFSSGLERDTELAIKDIIEIVASATKPNTDNKLATTGYSPYGSMYLCIYADKWADFTVDLKSKLFHPDPTVNAPFKDIRILNNGSITSDPQAFGYVMHPRFIYFIDRLNEFRNRYNTENLVDYLKLHHWTRLGIDGGYNGYQLVEAVAT